MCALPIYLGIRDPRGMFGDQLGVHMHIITASAGAVRNVSTCIQRCHLEPAAFVVSPYASGLASLVDDELELGATVIDMGGGATTIAVLYGHNVIFTDVIPVGGDRKSTRLNSVTNAHLVCRLLLEKKKKQST